jgi:RNA polymerase sigma-70 factor (ECF subfamily)
VDEALNSLKAEERFILAAYYLDGRTLAEIAAVLGVHASSISRRLDKIAVALRKQIVSELRDKGLSSRQAEELIQVDVRDLQVDIRARLAQDRQLKSFPDEKARARATQGPE